MIFFGDLDRDGDIDVLVINCDGPAKLLVNQCQTPGNSVSIELIQKNGQKAEGARVEGLLGDLKIHRQATRHYSYCVSNSPRLHVGLGGKATLKNVQVHWPNGEKSEHGDLSAGSRIRIVQP